MKFNIGDRVKIISPGYVRYWTQRGITGIDRGVVVGAEDNFILVQADNPTSVYHAKPGGWYESSLQLLDEEPFKGELDFEI